MTDLQPLKWKHLITSHLVRLHWSLDQYALPFLGLFYKRILPPFCNAIVYLLSFPSFTEVFGTLPIDLIFIPRPITIQMFTSPMRIIHVRLDCLTYSITLTSRPPVSHHPTYCLSAILNLSLFKSILKKLWNRNIPISDFLPPVYNFFLFLHSDTTIESIVWRVETSRTDSHLSAFI